MCSRLVIFLSQLLHDLYIAKIAIKLIQYRVKTMRSVQKKQVKLDIETLEFIVTPHSVDFRKGSKHLGRSFFIDMDKGQQFIKRFDQDVTLSKGTCFIFDSNESVPITVRNPKTANYSFTLYLHSQGFDSFTDTFPVKLIECYQLYRQELSQYTEEYNNILENMANKMGLGCSWETLKGQLQGYRQSLESKNNQETICIKYTVQIKTPIDRYADSMLSKTKLQTTSSLGSKKSNSSKNSIKQIKNNSLSSPLPQKTDKPSRLVKQNDFSVKNPEQLSCQSSPTPLVVELNQEAPNESAQKPIFYLPLQSLLHRPQHLSDIIEQSYEGSSNINSVERTDRKWKQLPEITEEIDIVHRKTEKILPNKGYDKDQLRRGSSWDQNQRRLSQKQIQSSNDEINNKQIDRWRSKQTNSKRQEMPRILQTINEGKYWWIVLCAICLLCFAVCSTEVLQGHRSLRGQMFPRVTRRKIIKEHIHE